MIRPRQILEDCDDIAMAHKAYMTQLSRAGADGDVMSTFAASLSAALTEKIRRLDGAFECGHASPALDPSWRSSAYVFVGDTAQQIFTTRFNGKAAILLDFDLICRLVLLMYFTGLDTAEDETAGGLAAFMLLTIVVPRTEPLPFMLPLLTEIAGEQGRLVNDLISIASSFLLFHELGHSYVAAGDRHHLRISFVPTDGPTFDKDAVTPIRLHAEGPVYSVYRAPGSNDFRLLMDSRFGHWKDEFSSDVFAAYAHLLSGQSPPDALDLEHLAASLTCWQLLLFALGRRERYLRATAGQPHDASMSHPPDHLRIDVLVWHLECMAQEHAPQWRSGALALLKRHYESIWAVDLASLVNEGIEYVRYGFERSGDNPREQSFALGPVPANPSAIEKMNENLMGPLLADARDSGLSEAMKARRSEDRAYLRTFKLNGEPILMTLGERLRQVGIVFTSEDP